MSDFRLVAARRLVWKAEAWRQPALLALAISALKQIMDSEVEPPESKAEAQMLIKKLYIAGKEPRLA